MCVCVWSIALTGDPENICSVTWLSAWKSLLKINYLLYSFYRFLSSVQNIVFQSALCHLLVAVLVNKVLFFCFDDDDDDEWPSKCRFWRSTSVADCSFMVLQLLHTHLMKKGAFFFIHFSRQLIFVSKLSLTKVLYINYKSLFTTTTTAPRIGRNACVWPPCRTFSFSFLFCFSLNWTIRKNAGVWSRADSAAGAAEAALTLLLCSCRALKKYDSLLGFKKCHLFLSASLSLDSFFFRSALQNEC